MSYKKRPTETEEEFRDRRNIPRRLKRDKAKALDTGLSLEDFRKLPPYRRVFGPRSHKQPEQVKREKQKNNNLEYRLPFRLFVDSFKVPCKCGESDPCALDFHHRNPKEKKFSISQAVRRMLSFEEIEQEVLKCDLLCANCHRKLHYSKELTVAPTSKNPATVRRVGSYFSLPDPPI